MRTREEKRKNEAKSLQSEEKKSLQDQKVGLNVK